MLKTVDEVIDALGGTTKVARKLGLKPNAISMMRQRGRLSSSWHMALFVEARRQGLQIAPELFGLEESA